MNIAFAASEVVPFAKTGGLGDVLGSLPIAIRKLGHDVKVFLPNYSSIDHFRFHINYCHNIGELLIRVNGMNHKVHLFMAHLPNSDVECYFVDCPYYYHRPHIYTNDHDEDERFILFSKAVIETLQRLRWQPDIIHCNDWQTGLIPLYIKDNYSWDTFFHHTATVITIHNIGYQGRFGKKTLWNAEIRSDLFYENGPVETMRSVNFLKIGLMFADAISTVSETYAYQIKTYEHGAGLDGVLNYRNKDFYGIINGVDYDIWNPEKDKLIPYNYSINDLSNKYKNKSHLLQTVHLPEKENTPLIGIVSRLVYQKGFDLVRDSIYELLSLPAQWIVLGSGEEEYERLFRAAAYSFPDKFFSFIGYNNELAHLIEAGADMFLMPSRYEPCGLNQIYSLKYGTVPIVHKTGGLADTVIDWNEYLAKGEEIGTGFSFNNFNTYALVNTVARAIKTYHYKDAWTTIMKNGMSKDFSWEVSAKKYLQLYDIALKNRRGN